MGTVKMNFRHNIICSIIIILIFVPILYSQQVLEDVVYFKDGSIMRGKIIEQIPGVSLKIKTQLGAIYTYSMERVDKITREPKKKINEIREHKYPGVAFLFSFFLPGGGQFYNDDLVKGYIQSGIAMTAVVICIEEGWHQIYTGGTNKAREGKMEATGIVLALDWLWSMIDAPISAIKINKRRKQVYGHLLRFEIGKDITGMDIRIQNNHLLATITYHF